MPTTHSTTERRPRALSFVEVFALYLAMFMATLGAWSEAKSLGAAPWAQAAVLYFLGMGACWLVWFLCKSGGSETSVRGLAIGWYAGSFIVIRVLLLQYATDYQIPSWLSYALQLAVGTSLGMLWTYGLHLLGVPMLARPKKKQDG